MLQGVTVLEGARRSALSILRLEFSTQDSMLHNYHIMSIASKGADNGVGWYQWEFGGGTAQHSGDCVGKVHEWQRKC